MNRSFILHLFVLKKEELASLMNIERKKRGPSIIDVAQEKIKQKEYAHLKSLFNEVIALKRKIIELYAPLLTSYIQKADEIDPSGSLEMKLHEGFSRAFDNTRYPDIAYVKKWLSTIISRHRTDVSIEFSDDNKHTDTDTDVVHYSSLPDFINTDFEDWDNIIDYSNLFKRLKERLSRHGRYDLLKVLEELREYFASNGHNKIPKEFKKQAEEIYAFAMFDMDMSVF